MIRNVKEGEAFYHETGDDDALKTMFWFSVSLPQSVYDEATNYALEEPEEGEPVRMSTRVDDYLATAAETIVLNSEVVQWLDDLEIDFSIDGGYFSHEVSAVLIWLDPYTDSSTRDAMLFKLRFGGNA